MNLTQLETPCLILDKAKLRKNVESMRDRMERLGVNLRPHAKTPKCIEAVRPALERQAKGLTVSTLKEAEYFFGHGVTDILYAVGIAPVKLERIARLRKRGAEIAVILDSLESAGVVAAAGRTLGVTFPVLIEVDSDGHRAGVTPDDPLLIDIGRLLHSQAGAELRGVMTHAGGSYDCRTVDEIRRVAGRERDVAVACAERLRRADLPCPVVSVGSTPTAAFAQDLSGVTEFRAGVYMFQDLVMAGLGVCRVEDIAISVLATVIGHQKDKGWAITDAGWMALSRDRGTARQAVDQGYGLACRLDGEPFEECVVGSASQEHGIIVRRQGGKLDFKDFPIGGAVRILPNHACATAAMFDRYHVVEGTTDVVDVWQRINGW